MNNTSPIDKNVSCESRIYKAFKFKVFVNSHEGIKEVGKFNEVSGLTISREYSDYRYGSSKSLFTVKVPGLMKSENVVMSSGITNSIEFWNWVVDHDYSKLFECLYVSLLGDSIDTPVVTWAIMNAVASRYVGPDLKAEVSQLAIEKVEFSHSGIQRLEKPI